MLEGALADNLDVVGNDDLLAVLLGRDRLGVQQAIADWAGVRKPDLNIMDAYRAMQTGGPRGNAASVILPLKSLLISTDMVAMDTAGARMLGIDPALATHIALAAEQGLGQNDLAKVNIKKITLS